MTAKTEQIRNFIYKIGLCIALCVGVFFLSQLLIGSLYYRVFFVMDMREMPKFYHNSFLIVIEVAALSAVLIFAGRVLKRIPEKWLFLCFSILYILAAVWLVFGTEPVVRADPSMVMKYVGKFNEGDYSGFEKGFYMNMFPYQLGLLTYERFLSIFSISLRFYFFANLGMVLLSNFFQWRIARELFDENETAVKYAILLSFMFLPMLFYIFWLYGQIPGLCFLLGAFWFLVRWLKERGHYNLALCALFAAVSYQMKMNYMIGTIAMALVLLLVFLKSGKLRNLAAIAVLFAAVLGMNFGVTAYYKHVSGYNFGVGTPYMSYLAMGLQESKSDRAPGWYNGYVWDLYIDNDSDSDVATQLSKEYIKQRVPELLANPNYTFHFFREKIAAAWCDPLYQAVWSGPTPEEERDLTSDPVLRNIYRGGRLYEVIEAYMNALNVLIFAGALAFIFRKHVFRLSAKLYRQSESQPAGSIDADRSEAIWFYLIYFIGGFIFHGISEAKGQYSFMYVYCLIPYLAYMLSNAAMSLKPTAKKRS